MCVYHVIRDGFVNHADPWCGGVGALGGLGKINRDRQIERQTDKFFTPYTGA